MTREELWDRLCVLLGGRVAGKLAVGEVSTGAAHGLQMATDMVRSMITEHGMSEKLGLAAYGRRRPLFVKSEMHGCSQEYSEETAKSIDSEISQTLYKAHRRVKQILQGERRHLEIVAQALLERETLSGEELPGAFGKQGKKGGIERVPGIGDRVSEVSPPTPDTRHPTPDTRQATSSSSSWSSILMQPITL